MNYIFLFGLNIFYYFNFTINMQVNTYSTRLGIETEDKCLLSSSPCVSPFLFVKITLNHLVGSTLLTVNREARICSDFG